MSLSVSELARFIAANPEAIIAELTAVRVSTVTQDGDCTFASGALAGSP